MRAISGWIAALAIALASAVVLADDHSVIYDEDIDFSIFKTFTVRAVRLDSDRPELKFPAVLKSIDDAVRSNLKSLGLTEAASNGDLIVECNASGTDFNIGPWGRPNTLPSTARGRGRSGAQPLPVDFTEITMVLDLIRADTKDLVFRGVYHDEEKDGEKLAKALPRDAATLLLQYPRKKRD